MNYSDDRIVLLTLTPSPSWEIATDNDVDCDRIEDAKKASSHSDSFVIKHKRSVTGDGIYKIVKELDPKIIHFAGHCDSENGLVLEEEQTNENGRTWRKASFFSFENVIDMISQTTRLQCVFLNACESISLARVISNNFPHICVIAVKSVAENSLAVSFSRHYYTALFSGKSYSDAFVYAKNEYRSVQQKELSYDPVIFDSNIKGLNPLLTNRYMPEWLRLQKPEGEIFPSLIQNGEQIFQFEEFSQNTLFDILKTDIDKPIIITGEAFSGKTAILSCFYEANREKSAFYVVRVSELDYSPLHINENKISNPMIVEPWEKTLAEDFSKYSLEDAIIIIDGVDNLNRIIQGTHYASVDDKLLADINVLRSKCKNRIVLTSRFIPAIFLRSFDEYSIQKLDAQLVERYLLSYRDKLTNRQYNFLNKPDMARLVDTLRTAGLLKDFLYDIGGDYHINELLATAHIETPTTRGEIIWNYFCIEMLRTRDANGIANPCEDGAKALLILRYIAPYIAYRLSPENSLKVGSNKFKEIVALAQLTYKNANDYFDDLDEINDGFGISLDVLTEASIKPFLVETYRLMRTNNDGSFEFIHPLYAEVLWAIHVYNQIKMRNRDILAEELNPSQIALLSDVMREHTTFSKGE